MPNDHMLYLIGQLILVIQKEVLKRGTIDDLRISKTDAYREESLQEHGVLNPKAVVDIGPSREKGGSRLQGPMNRPP
jgi:hypothetical protein